MIRHLPRSLRSRDESGQMAGMETLPLGLLVFVVAVLLVANAWAVIDAKVAVSAAAREATRAYVEAPAGSDPVQLAEEAARRAFEGAGRDAARLELVPLEGRFTRCHRVRFEARYQVAAVSVPWVGGYGRGFTASARHTELVDPFRTGVPGGEGGCDAVE